MAEVCRWGILGTATIARKNWQAIRNAENATLAAVASRDGTRSRQFIAECQGQVPFERLPHACGSYEELLARDDVDAVYVPLPTAVRKEWVLRAAGAGKHVLCEKPCGIAAADVREMIDACARSRVQFMDGVMFMHSRRLQRLRELLDDGRSVGPIRRIATQFSFRAPDAFFRSNIRACSALEPLGCLGDLGWYNIRLILWAMQYRLPERVAGRMLTAHGPDAVPVEFSGELLYPGGVSASFYCSFVTENQQWAGISGTHGNVHVPDFVLPFYGCESSLELRQSVFNVRGCDFNMEERRQRIAVPEYSNSAPDAPETNMIRRFSRIVQTGELEPRWGGIAVETQTVLDACLESARHEGRMVRVQ